MRLRRWSGRGAPAPGSKTRIEFTYRLAAGTDKGLSKSGGLEWSGKRGSRARRGEQVSDQVEQIEGSRAGAYRGGPKALMAPPPRCHPRSAGRGRSGAAIRVDAGLEEGPQTPTQARVESKGSWCLVITHTPGC